MTEKVYIWRSEKSSATCDKCKNLDGKIFTRKEDAPYIPLHPNCKCKLTEERKEEHGYFIATDDFKDKIGEKESSGVYDKYNSKGGGKGAFGKYQLRQGVLQDIGMMDEKGHWTGKNGITSGEDFLNNPQAQEKTADDAFKAYSKQLKNNGSYQYINQEIKGKTGKVIPITEEGLIAAAHREGSSAVKRYLHALEINKRGEYYTDYEELEGSKDETTFARIETRLREFAEVK